MKPVIIPMQEKTLNNLLKKARRRNVIIESENGERFVLASISKWQGFDVGNGDFEEEVKRTAQNKKLVKVMAGRRVRNIGKQLYSSKEARKKLGLK